MVTHYPHHITSQEASADAFRAEDGLVRIFDRVRQVFCGMHGHDSLLQFEQERMFLKCVSCGHETPGWELNETPPTVSVHGDARRHALIRPQFIGERRLA